MGTSCPRCTRPTVYVEEVGWIHVETPRFAHFDWSTCNEALPPRERWWKKLLRGDPKWFS